MRDAKAARERGEGGLGERVGVAADERGWGQEAAGGDTGDLRWDARELGCAPVTFVAGDGGHDAVLDDEGAGQNEARDLGVTELAEEAPHVAIDGLAPDLLARIEVTADEGRGETRVDGGGVEGGLTASA